MQIAVTTLKMMANVKACKSDRLVTTFHGFIFTDFWVEINGSICKHIYNKQNLHK